MWAVTMLSQQRMCLSLLAELSHDEAKMRERRERERESLSFLSFLPRRERPLLAGKCD